MDNNAETGWRKFAEGDESAWREVLDTAVNNLYTMFIRKWPNASAAEELVSKTVFDAVSARQSYDPKKGSPTQWLFGIANNNLALEARKRAVRNEHQSDIFFFLDSLERQDLPDEVLEKQETAQIVRSALEQIDPREKQALVMKYIDGQSAGRISLSLGITEKAVHSLLCRARISLRNELKQMAPLIKEERKNE